MLVADVQKPASSESGQAPRLVAVADILEMPRLGQDLDRTGRLHPDAIERGVAAITRQLKRARDLGAESVLAIGTESLRAASNSSEFLSRIAALGIPLRIISSDDEARLSFHSVVRSLPMPPGGRRSVLDIGGGSTELIVGGTRPERWASVKIGSVRLTERLLPSDPPTPAEQHALIETVRAAIAALPEPEGELCALAGTATTIAAIHLGLAEHDSARLDGLSIPTEAVAAIAHRLAAMPLAQRRQLPGLDPRRADVIYAGAVILWQVALRAAVAEIVISDRGVRWGVLEEVVDQLAGPPN
jgi:exopolyphosphatase/guanosine-5'-triphosphate,3'-diphosphate pyrophosphatase